MKKLSIKKIGLMIVCVTLTGGLLAGCQSAASVSSASETVAAVEPAATANSSQTESENGTPPSGEIPNGGGDMSGSSTGNIALSGVYAVDGTSETSDAETITSTSGDENTVLVTGGGELSMTNAVLSKTGDTSSADESNFYGVNAVVAAADGSTASVADTAITSSAEGSNAIFATGGSTITAENITIYTTANSSRGLDATYDGVINASNVNITTEGAHSATIATDRGEGTITVVGGTVSAAGDGSPCIYSTGNITVSDLTGTATGSQAAVVEGKNSITLNSSSLNGAGLNGIMLYQSTSGDAAEGTASFTAADSTIETTSTGPMIYVTNTTAEATFTNTVLSFSSGILANIAGNDTNNWGTPGSNGGIFTLTGVNQVFEGDITCDAISTVALVLTEGSTYTGCINADNTAAGASVTLDDSSVWTVTGDCYLGAIANDLVDCSNINSGGHSIYYDAVNSVNSWLDGQTITLTGGGKLTPAV